MWKTLIIVSFLSVIILEPSLTKKARAECEVGEVIQLVQEGLKKKVIKRMCDKKVETRCKLGKVIKWAKKGLDEEAIYAKCSPKSPKSGKRMDPIAEGSSSDVAGVADESVTVASVASSDSTSTTPPSTVATEASSATASVVEESASSPASAPVQSASAAPKVGPTTSAPTTSSSTGPQFEESSNAGGNIDPSDTGERFAWGENIGWVSFDPATGPGVTVTDTDLSGRAWGENIGWVTMNPTSGGGVVNDGNGNLSGSAWSENGGWINFAPATGNVGVTINTGTGEFSGEAWSENFGWLRFRNESGSVIFFGVTTSWPGVVVLLCDVDGDEDIDRDDITAIFQARNAPASGPDDPMDKDGNGQITVTDARLCVLLCTNAGCATS